MVKVLLQRANLLLLDEPTNHLDLYAKAVLLQAFQQYDGTILFVSHDHAFIQDLATDILELTSNGLYYYPGTYEDFLDDKRRREAATAPIKKHPMEFKSSKQRMHSKDDQKELKKIERQIEKLEKDLEKKYLQLAPLDFGSTEYQKIINKIDEIKETVAKAYQEWEQLQK